ncbi:MAG: DsrH/TusB family sulfur metabolism protein [Lysobacterales bacterium]
MAAVSGPTCLHLVAGDGREALEDCLSLCVAGDALLFLDAGVLQLLQALPGLPSGAEAHFLAADLQARGLLDVARRRQLSVLDDDAFCDLLTAHGRCLTWT